MIEEPMKPKKKDQIRLDEEAAKRLQAEFDEEERLPREKAIKEQEANIALIKEWNDIQAKIDVDYQLAKRLQAQEQKELSDAKKATLFQQLLEKRRNYYNMEGYKLIDLKLKEFDSIKEMFDRAFGKVNTIVDYRIELVKGNEKRVGEELIQESIKKQKVDDDKEKDALKQLMETIPDEEEVAINTIPLAVKSLRIVDWKIHKEGKKSYYQIIRAYGKSQMCMFFSQMLKVLTRKIRKTCTKNEVWKKQQGYKVLEWKLYNSCRVHSLRMQSMQIYMLDRPTDWTDARSEAHKSHHKNAKNFLKLVEEKFSSADKSLARTLMAELTTMKFDGLKSMQQHVLDMTNTIARLKTLGMNVNDSFFKLIQKETRLKKLRVHSINLVNQGVDKKLKPKSKNCKKKHHVTTSKVANGEKREQHNNKCNFCNKDGHFQKDCPKRKAWFEKKSIHYVSVCFESNLYEVPSNTWWFDSGATTHVSNIM
nr:hypothetical protein [Tanacetum cinerariifolium]